MTPSLYSDWCRAAIPATAVFNGVARKYARQD